MTARLPKHSLVAFSHFVEKRTGLQFPEKRWPELRLALEQATLEFGYAGADQCAQALYSGEAKTHEWEIFTTFLTTGETYFFREGKAFEALEMTILPELIAARRATSRRLRIWSAGCSTGEEPYSIAIALSRILPDLTDWKITILGTDLNPRSLQKAEAGVYKAWSFRTTPPEVQARYFHAVADGGFQISSAIRRLVFFRVVNLIEDSFPSLLNNTCAMDLILCRNVLMYFNRAQAQKVVARLHASLVPGGWICPSPPEASRELFSQFQPVSFPEAMLFRKEASTPMEPAPKKVPHAKRPAPRRKVQQVTRSAGATAQAEEDSSARARQLANEGHLTAALTACDRALKGEKLVASHYYLRGLILEAQGVAEEAATALRRALYLDPEFVLAHFALGNLMRRAARKQEAQRCFANARTLLAGYDPTALLPESDGLAAGRLLAILELAQN